MGYKTKFLLGAATNIAVQHIVSPALQQAPEIIARMSAQRRWTLHFFCLSLSNPADSFCCVSEGAITADPISLLAQRSLSPLLPIQFVPARFSKHGLAGLSVRASSISAPTPINQHWLGRAESIGSVRTVDDAGIELLNVQRRSDRMQFIVAGSVSAAQTAMANLSMTQPLWNELNQSGPAVPGIFSQVFG